MSTPHSACFSGLPGLHSWATSLLLEDLTGLAVCPSLDVIDGVTITALNIVGFVHVGETPFVFYTTIMTQDGGLCQPFYLRVR